MGPDLEGELLDLTSDVEDAEDTSAGYGMPVITVDESVPLLVQPSYVYHGVYCAGARPLMPVEVDLKLELLRQDLYLVRGVQAAKLAYPSDDPAELLAFAIVVHG